MNKSILITDKVHPKLISQLEVDNYQINYLPKLSLEETHKIIHKYCGVIVNSKTICDKDLIDKGVDLKFIGRLGSGLEIIDLDYAKAKGIRVMRTPEANCGSVAEQALGMILSLFNNLKKGSRQLQSLNWQREDNRGIELAGKTVGLIGYGHTGMAFAKLLRAFDIDLLCNDKYKSGFDNEATLSQIKAEADVISIHLPLTSETIGYMDDTFINSCAKPFYLINTARGKNVKTLDLLDGLDSGKILGACLDVFENEKVATFSAEEELMYSDLMNRQNVICMPHVAGWTHESLERIADSMLAQIRSL